MPSRAPLRPRKHLLALALVLGAGCGGKVIFDGAGGGTNKSTSASTGGAECVVGACGDQCTKCMNGSCFTGKCDANLKCQPPGATPMCTK